jgi:hypothetical protein
MAIRVLRAARLKKEKEGEKTRGIMTTIGEYMPTKGPPWGSRFGLEALPPY